MENKYFTPDIEDIRVGYEGEYHNWSMDEAGIPELNYDRWEKAILNKSNVEIMLKYGIKGFRVPYLTKEQIEAEGWNKNDISPNLIKKIDEDSYYSVSLNKDYNIVITKCFINGWSWVWQPFYSGECKDINTFRYICKLLGI